MIEFRPPRGSLPGEWEPGPLLVDAGTLGLSYQSLPSGARLLQRVLSPDDCQRLVRAMKGSGQAQRVGVSGQSSGVGALGSWRATAWSPELARQLWLSVAQSVPETRQMQDQTPTDWYALGTRRAHRRWQRVGLGPVLRFMRYDAGGSHLPHYDKGFDYPDSRRSLMSLVFYLTDSAPNAGGHTRLIEDGQGAVPVWLRNHDDWPRPADARQVLAWVRPRAGDAFLFDHRLCHDVELCRGFAPRVVIRADVVFKALDRGTGVSCIGS